MLDVDNKIPKISKYYHTLTEGLCHICHCINIFKKVTVYTEDLKAPTIVSSPSKAVCDEDTMSSTSVGMSDLSDEILLCILRHVPVCDLLLNVANVCHKLHTLCHDKTLLTNISLSEEYMVKLLK